MHIGRCRWGRQSFTTSTMSLAIFCYGWMIPFLFFPAHIFSSLLPSKIHIQRFFFFSLPLFQMGLRILSSLSLSYLIRERALLISRSKPGSLFSLRLFVPCFAFYGGDATMPYEGWRHFACVKLWNCGRRLHAPYRNVQLSCFEVVWLQDAIRSLGSRCASLHLRSLQLNGILCDRHRSEIPRV